MRYELKAKANKAELFIYGDIGENWDEEQSNDAKKIVSQISKLDTKSLDIKINSYGGVVADGLAISNAIKRFNGKTTAYNDGVAYSIASLIFMAADERIMAENSLLMIHAPWGMTVGNAEDMREMAESLDKTAEAMATSYVVEGGPDKDEILSMLKDGKDHYFTAEESVTAGFANAFGAQIDIAASLRQCRFIPPEGKLLEVNMTDKETGVGPKEPTDDYVRNHSKAVKAGHDKGAKDENRRIRDVTAVFADFVSDDPTDPLNALKDDCLSDLNCDVNEANRRLIQALKGRTDFPVASIQQQSDLGAYANSVIARPQRIVQGVDSVDKFVSGATESILIRAGIERNQDKIQEARKGEYLSMSLKELAKASLKVSGQPVHGSDEDIVRRVLAAGGPGQGTDHFPAILENIANKAVMDGFMGAAETWNRWTIPGTLNDYRTASRVNKSLFDTLDKMEEFEGFKHGRFADVKQNITGYLHGKSFSLTLQAIVNDDLSMLSEDAMAWGEAANVTIGDAVFTVLTAAGTGGFGQTMTEDSQILFHADHSNYIASGSGAAPSAATIGAGRTAMITQTDPNSRTVAQPPRYLIHPTTLTMTVFPLLNSQNLITGADTTVGERNAVQSLGLESVEEYRMDGFVSTAWILAAARRTVEVAFVGGQSTPRVDRMPSGEIPGITWQISIPFGVAALDYRTFYFNYGG